MIEERENGDIREESGASPEERQEKGKKGSDVGIFVFLGIMVLLMIGAIVFVICITSGTAAGCNCGKC